MADSKRCTKCGEVKLCSEFHKNARKPDGLRPECKGCRVKKTPEQKCRYNKADRERRRRPDVAARIREYKRVKRRADRGDPRRNLDARLSEQIRLQLKARGGKGGRRWVELAPFSLDELRAHLERQFLPGMGWHNMAEWHIDHILPKDSFQYSGPDDPEFAACWALPNLRPLWAADNHAKGSRPNTLI